MGPKVKLPLERPGIIHDNPEKFYTFGEEIGKGKYAVTKHCTHKLDGTKHAAKIIKFDADSLKFAAREYDFMVEKMKLDHSGGSPVHPGLVELSAVYLVRKYLILIMDCADGLTLLDYAVKRHTLNEDSVAGWIKQIVEVLACMHANNCVHLDIRPTNIRFMANANLLKLVDYNACRHVANKKAGAVVDVIGDTEFCAPEMLNFEPVSPPTDIWSVAILAYILLSGISPFFDEDEDKVVAAVQKAKWAFDPDAFANISSEAKDFIQKCLKRAPEQRLTAQGCLEHKWLSDDYASVRKGSTLDIEMTLKETDERLYEEEEEDYVEASLTFRTYDEEEYVSPEESEDEEDE